jgi:hypothetical protein
MASESIMSPENITNNGSVESMGNDQSTTEQHHQHSTMEPMKETQKEIIEEATNVLEKLKEASTHSTHEDKDLAEKKKQIKNIESMIF